MNATRKRRRTQVAACVVVSALSVGGCARTHHERSAVDDNRSIGVIEADKPFEVQSIAPGVYAIRESAFPMKNACFLIAGRDKALMIDAGSTKTHDITAVVRSITDLPVAMIPSHLHFNHIGGIYRFSEVWMVDVPFTRGMGTADGKMLLAESATLSPEPSDFATPFRVARYIQSGSRIDLGGKSLTIYLAIGHTPEDVVIKSDTDDIVFTGDLITGSNLIIGNLDDHIRSAEFVESLSDAGTKIYGAHDDPRLANPPLEALSKARLSGITAFLKRIQRHQAKGVRVQEWAGMLSLSTPAMLYSTDDDIDVLHDAVVGGFPFSYP